MKIRDIPDLILLGPLIEQSLILNIRNKAADDYFIKRGQLAEKMCIYMCTTMYREADHEMEQLLQSISGIDAAKKQSQMMFESHIFIDDGARGEVCPRVFTLITPL